MIYYIPWIGKGCLIQLLAAGHQKRLDLFPAWYWDLERCSLVVPSIYPGYLTEPLRIQIYVKLRTYEELKSLIQRADITFLTLCSGHGSTYRILLIYEGQWPPRDINTMTIRWRKWHFCSIARYFCLTEMVISLSSISVHLDGHCYCTLQSIQHRSWKWLCHTAGR